MKRIFPLTVITLLLFANAFATDRFVNPNLSQGNGTTLFTTITAAVAAAENGDRIIVTSSTYNEAELTINKSLQIIPQTAGTTINFNANIKISSTSELKVELIGLNLGFYSVLAVNDGLPNNPTSLNLINISCENILIDKDYIIPNIIESNVANEIIIRAGNVLKTNCNKLFIYDGPDSNLLLGNIIISNNNISSVLQFYNDDLKFIISNNILHDIYITNWNKNIELSNEIFNNNFISKDNNCNALTGNAPRVYFSVVGQLGGCCDYYTEFRVSYYNIIFTSNLFDTSPLFPKPSYMDSGTSPQFSTNQDRNLIRNIYNSCQEPSRNYGWNSLSSIFPNEYSSGYFEWSYNHKKLPKTINTATSLSFTNLESLSLINDAGNPNHKYYDIDLTINDRGINGGPYSQLNYNASNPNNSRAFIFDLEMPSDIFPNGNIEIKAKAYHKN
ncbi:MAG: hypothetical protein ABF260_08935 [Flavobacteriaceae bacterium]